MIVRYTSKKSIEEVFQYLYDMQKFAEVHPVIYKIEKKGENHYLFFEKLKFLLFFPYDFTYNVVIKNIEFNKSLQMYSEVQKGVHLNLNFLLQTENNLTIIVETIETKAIIGVKQILEMTVKKAHRKMFENIEID